MPDHLCIIIRFLDGAFHGRADHGEPEWPPSPLRLYQAIVAAAAARWRDHKGMSHAEPALRWLEQLPPPTIVAPNADKAQGYRLYVPDNAGDLVGKSWSRGNDNSMANYRTEKTIRPMVFQSEGAVHYLWSLADLPPGIEQHRDILFEAVHAITHIGWGVDLVVAHAAEITADEAKALSGQEWLPSDQGGSRELRTPRSGTLDDLNQRHTAFLSRVSGDGLAPVPPLSVFGITGYRADNEPPHASHAIFALRQPDASGYRTFETTRRSLHVAGMMRHLASDPALLRSIGWTEEMARQVVLGHSGAKGDGAQSVEGPRLAFIPLPSIELRGDGKANTVGRVRRVLVTLRGELPGGAFDRLLRRLQSSELIDGKSNDVTAVLQRQATSGATYPYLNPASTWATVTPVILPGYDDPCKLRHRLRDGAERMTADGKAEILRKLDQRIDLLLRKALRQAGFSELLVRHAELDWRNSGFWAGTALATEYAAGDQHRRYRRLHVKITWCDAAGQSIEVPGPICIGGGKFTGMGLFAALP